jgi:hypothetical protein
MQDATHTTGNQDMAYIHRHYIPQLLRRLAEEYKLHSSVLELCSSVIEL